MSRAASYRGSTFVPDEESCFCRFEGCDIAAVEEANRRADAPFWRVVEAVFIERDVGEGLRGSADDMREGLR